MKIGIHLSSYTSQWDDPGLDYVAHAARTGYAGVELPLMHPESYDRQHAKDVLKEYGMQCTCGTGVNTEEDPSSEDPEIRKKGLERLKRCIEICDFLESDCLGGVLCSPWMQLKRRDRAAENYRWAVDSMYQAAEYAKAHGVILAIEVLNRYESYFINTIEEGMQFLNQMQHENLKLHYDSFHANIEEGDLVQAIRNGGTLIGHVHLCDNNRAAPGTGHIDFIKIHKALTEIGYDRWVTVENFVIPYSEVGEGVCVWAQKAQDPYDNAEKAFRYVNGLWRGKR